MRIQTYQEKGRWHADFLDLPGTPYIGDGETEAMAVAVLFLRNMHVNKDHKIFNNPEERLFINDKEYSYA